MKHIQQRKPEAFNEMHRRYSKRLLHFFYRMLNHDEARAQDLLQDLFLKLVEAPEKFDTSRSFKPWVFTVAANLARKEFRQPISQELKEDYMSSGENLVDGLIGPIDTKIFKKHLRKELLELSYEHRTVFILRHQEKLSLQEIADVMDCSLGTVKSRLFNANKKLAGKLKIFKPHYQNK